MRKRVHESFTSWVDWFELFLACDAFILILFNIGVLFYKKVYTAWSTTSILLSCTALLLARICCLYFYIWYVQVENLDYYLLITSLINDLPNYLNLQISLALIWQWWRIASLLGATQKQEVQAIQSGQSDKRLLYIQLCLLVMFLADFTLLLLHYVFNLWTEEQEFRDPRKVTQDPVWVRIRGSVKIVQLALFFAVSVLSFVVFYRVVQALNSNRDYQPLKKQVYVFMAIYLSQGVVRFGCFCFAQYTWYERNVVNEVANVQTLDKQAEATILVVTIFELFLDFFLIYYLFIGSSKKENYDESDQGSAPLLSVDADQSSKPSDQKPYLLNKKARREGNHRRLETIHEQKEKPEKVKKEARSTSEQNFSPMQGKPSTTRLTDSSPCQSEDQDLQKSRMTEQLSTDIQRENLDAMTVDASSEESDDGQFEYLKVDKNNNVYQTGLWRDDQSDQESLDLNKLPRLPKARQNVRETISSAGFIADKDLQAFDQSHQNQIQQINREIVSENFGKTKSEKSVTLSQKRPHPQKATASEPVKFFFGPGRLIHQVNKIHREHSQLIEQKNRNESDTDMSGDLALSGSSRPLTREISNSVALKRDSSESQNLLQPNLSEQNLLQTQQDRMAQSKLLQNQTPSSGEINQMRTISPEDSFNLPFGSKSND